MTTKTCSDQIMCIILSHVFQTKKKFALHIRMTDNYNDLSPCSLAVKIVKH